MCRRSSLLAIVGGLMASAAPVPAAPTRAPAQVERELDLRLDDFLESHELLSLRVAHLEAVLAATPPTEVSDVAARLARAYAALMERATDEAQRLQFEARSSELLRLAPGADTLDLRLALARSRYVRAESVAERRRLALATVAEAGQARTEFLELIPIFDALADRAELRIRELERQVEAGAPRDELMMQALNGSRQARSMAGYFAGWSGHYAAELGGEASRDSVAKSAQIRFAPILDGRRGVVPDRDRVDLAMMRYEHVARACIAVALCWSLRGNPDEALKWLDMVESAPKAASAVLAQIPAKRFIVLARARQWARLYAAAERLTQRQPGLSAPDARLLALLAMEESAPLDDANRDARDRMARLAMIALIQASAGAPAFDLVEAYLARTAADESDSTFLARFLRAVREFEGARSAHVGQGGALDAPASDTVAVRRFQTAARLIDGALSAGDAEDFKAATPRAILLRALASFYSAGSPGDLDGAADALALASESLRDLDAEKSVASARLAIRAVELAAAQKPAQARANRRNELIDAFVRAHPDDPAAGAYALQRARAAEAARPKETIEELLAIEGTAEVRSAAQHEAARLLYQRYVEAQGVVRADLGRRFLKVSAPLLEADHRRLVTGDQAEAERALLNARRALDCALALKPPAAGVAMRAFDVFALLHASGFVQGAVVQSEFVYRSVQIRLLHGDFSAAAAEAERLATMDPRLHVAAQQALYRHAVELWREDRSSERARAVIRFGRPLLRNPGEEQSSSAHVAVIAAMAQASAQLWQESRSEDDREFALILFRTGLRADPLNRTLLYESGMFFEAAGESQAALESWRTLLGGLPAGSRDWFEAKVRLLSLLAELEPARARELVAQHRAVYPDLGPQPFNEQIEAIERKLGSGAEAGS